MSISELPSRQRGPATLVAEAVAFLREAADVFFAAPSDEELVATVEEVQTARAALAVVQAGAVAEVDARGVAKDKLAYGSTGDWLTHVGGLRKGEGRRLVARAHALTGPLSLTREALATGA